MEPVICNLGVLIPENEFMVRLDKLCHEYGTLLIVDEVATGFGRTGELFASEHFNIEPDIMCLAKALTGGHAPLGATVMTEEIATSIEEEFSFYSTYGWHPLSVDAAIATIRYIRKHRAALLGQVTELSNYFRTRLSRMSFKHPATMRIKDSLSGWSSRTPIMRRSLLISAAEQGCC